jgi:hypothetical protein
MGVSVLAACLIVAFASNCHADARSDVADGVEAYVTKALTAKPSLVDHVGGALHE